MSEVDIKNQLDLERAKARKAQQQKQSSGSTSVPLQRYKPASSGNTSRLSGKDIGENLLPEAIEAENLLQRRRALLAYRKLNKEGSRQSAEYVKNKAFRKVTNRWKMLSWIALFNVETIIGPIIALLYLNFHALASMFGKGDKFKMNILEYVGVFIADMVVVGVIAGIFVAIFSVISLVTGILQTKDAVIKFLNIYSLMPIPGSSVFSIISKGLQLIGN